MEGSYSLTYRKDIRVSCQYAGWRREGPVRQLRPMFALLATRGTAHRWAGLLPSLAKREILIPGAMSRYVELPSSEKSLARCRLGFLGPKASIGAQGVAF